MLLLFDEELYDNMQPKKNENISNRCSTRKTNGHITWKFNKNIFKERSTHKFITRLYLQKSVLDRIVLKGYFAHEHSRAKKKQDRYRTSAIQHSIRSWTMVGMTQ
jgi:hypothetical protein